MTDDYNGPANWTAETMKDPAEWMIRLTAAQINDLAQAVRHARAAGVGIEKLSRDDFPLTAFDQLIPEVRERLENGRGVVVLRGFPALDYNKEDLRLMYWGLGLHLGTGVSPSSKGDLLGDVKNFGQDVHSATGRGYMSNQGLGFHADTADVVVLLVMRAARSGGLSMIASSVAIRNEIARTRPDLLEELYKPVYWSWKGQEKAGGSPYYTQPIYSEHRGKFSSRYIRPHIVQAHASFPELGPMPPKLLEAMDLIASLANDPRFHFGMMFEPGDIQLLNNHVTMHSRTAFEDFDEPDRKRHLLRMWLSMPNTRELSPLMHGIYRDQSAGAVRGGFPSRNGGHSFETVAAQD